MARYSMLIDTQTCVGCLSCTVACKVENGSPPGVWFAPVIQREQGEFPEVRRLYLPLLCMHCEDPACVRACPAGAIRRRPDGIVVVDQDNCCGSRACMVACPHGALHFYTGPSYYFGQPTPLEESKLARLQPGTAQKCNLCAPRVEQGLEPACVPACPTDSRIFGDLDDPKSEISKRLKAEESVPLAGGAFTKPSVQYTARGVESAGIGKEALALPYRTQEIWHLPHAAEFSMLGAGAGLHMASLLMGFDPRVGGLGLVSLLALLPVAVAGLVLVADLGRPLRFWMALRNQSGSWLSRGALADFVFIIALLILALLPPGESPGLRIAVAAVGVAAALLVATYPALAMGSYRSVPAWFGPTLPLEFLVEGIASGVALVALLQLATGGAGTTAPWLLALAAVRLGFFLRRRRLVAAPASAHDPAGAGQGDSIAARWDRWGVLAVGVGGSVLFAGAALLLGGSATPWLAALAGISTLVGALAGKSVALGIGATPVAESPEPWAQVAHA